jgi:alkylation response protein AidB-like acyl-CoA dehydrogenase
MTEPSAGSDLRRIRTTAERDGFSWVINGSKTFITDGINADIIVACRAGEVGSKGLSLIVVETGTRASHAARTWTSSACTLRTPASCSSTTSGYPREPARQGGRRPPPDGGAALGAAQRRGESLTAARAAINWTVAHTRERAAFGAVVVSSRTPGSSWRRPSPGGRARSLYRPGSAGIQWRVHPVDAAKAKLWASEVQNRVTDRCLQLFGGYGYMMEYLICRAFEDARVSSIYAGTSEIMKLIISRDLTGLR